ncbi:MAG: nucleotide sugar dehydrogenase, partial [Candidatus Binatia bacterium]
MSHATELVRRFGSREGVVGVIGLGYVGLPLSCTIVEAGLRVIGFDVDPAKVERLGRGESYIRHIDAQRVRALLAKGERLEDLAAPGAGAGFRPTTDFSKLSLCDAILICVPTPLTEGREPDLSYVRGTAEQVAERLRPGQLVVLESTTYPGTTEEVVQPALERGGFRVGRDVHLAFSPEREDPGNPRFSTRTTPKIVGGVTPACGEAAVALYSCFVEKVVPVSSARVAEAAKLLENVYRGVNIALVNELKML